MRLCYRSPLPVAASPLPASVPDLSRVGPRPDSGPSNPDPGPIEGESGDLAEPRSGLRGGMWESGGENLGSLREPGERIVPGTSEGCAWCLLSELRD